VISAFLLCALCVKSFLFPRVCHSNHTSYNLFVALSEFRRPYLVCALLLSWSLFLCPPIHAQQQPAQSADKQSAPQTPAQIELLETKVRFETNGDSRKEVHCIVKISSELGVRQFARLNFDYNRSFESIDIPLVRITHPSGGTADILPSAITDNPNPVVVNAPAYQDVRVKSVRILGLAPGDNLEYRVLTTVSHHPLAPDFWLDHSFDRSGVVTEEIFELDLPGHLNSTTRMTGPGNGRLAAIYVGVPWTSRQHSGEGDSARSEYRWEIASTRTLPPAVDDDRVPAPDVIVSSFWGWNRIVERLAPQFLSGTEEDRKEIQDRLIAFAPRAKTPVMMLRASYEFVSQKLRTVDLPVGATGFQIRHAREIFDSGYATPEEKCFLMAKLASLAGSTPEILFAGAPELQKQFPRPTVFNHIFVAVSEKKKRFALDPSVEVAPFGVIPSQFRGKPAFTLTPFDAGDVIYEPWAVLPTDLPFPSSQRVTVDAALADDGKLTAKVHYSMRGDNELLLRVAFHQAPKEKWKDLAQLLSLSDGFRGKVTSVTASDPSATREPFTLDYEITMPKFVDWSKKPVRIPALLPQIGLPDPPAKPSAGAAASPIELGTPLEVETHMTLHLPPGTTVRTPTGTSVQRDYATFASQYSAKGPTIAASRHINFLLREVSAERAADYNAFLRAVQNDGAQDFTLDRQDTSPTEPKPSAPKTPASAQTGPSKP
jgi:hypothetical protein